MVVRFRGSLVLRVIADGSTRLGHYGITGMCERVEALGAHCGSLRAAGAGRASRHWCRATSIDTGSSRYARLHLDALGDGGEQFIDDKWLVDDAKRPVAQQLIDLIRRNMAGHDQYTRVRIDRA
jgi:hypothetical protein